VSKSVSFMLQFSVSPELLCMGYMVFHGLCREATVVCNWPLSVRKGISPGGDGCYLGSALSLV